MKIVKVSSLGSPASLPALTTLSRDYVVPYAECLHCSLTHRSDQILLLPFAPSHE